jgi:hypothetical protein
MVPVPFFFSGRQRCPMRMPGLRPHLCPRQGSNLRPRPSEGRALDPTELRGQLTRSMDLEGIEPSSPACETSVLPLNYRPCCAPRRSRTDCLRFTKPALHPDELAGLTCRPSESNRVLPLFRRTRGPPTPGRLSLRHMHLFRAERIERPSPGDRPGALPLDDTRAAVSRPRRELNPARRFCRPQPSRREQGQKRESKTRQERRPDARLFCLQGVWV